KCPLYAVPSCAPYVGLTLLSMSSTNAVGARRACTRSIQRPDRSARAVRFRSSVIALVSKRPIWLVDAACSVTARPPTIQRIAACPAQPLHPPRRPAAAPTLLPNPLRPIVASRVRITLQGHHLRNPGLNSVEPIRRGDRRTGRCAVYAMSMRSCGRLLGGRG